MLNESQIMDAHRQYLKIGSLQKTSEWINKTWEVDIRRNALSKLFHSRDLFVKTPNGQAQKYRPTTYKTPESHLARYVIKSAFDDLRDETGIYYESACYFISSELYEVYLSLLYESSSLKYVGRDILPDWVNMVDLEKGVESYTQAEKHFLLTPHKY